MLKLKEFNNDQSRISFMSGINVCNVIFYQILFNECMVYLYVCFQMFQLLNIHIKEIDCLNLPDNWN